jgi:hypothetical protein
MNFFFSLKTKLFKSRICIAKFNNFGKICKKIKLYSVKVDNKDEEYFWNLRAAEAHEDEFFFTVENKSIQDNQFYFLAKEDEILNFNKILLKKGISKFTDTVPDYRCNSRLYLSNGPFSSYQADYPDRMIGAKGSIVSSIGSLLSDENQINKIIFVNIFEKPIISKFEFYIIDYEKEKILHKGNIFTNSINEIDVNPSWIKPSNFLFTKNYIGIPVYVSSNGNNISCEHTHPMTEYVFGNQKFIAVKIFKEKINEIIKKNSYK